ncbi:MAG UNVERIFIED_CONTAM: hypothetical protein LVR18_45405 [Planctomycetaceae bacterium]
MIRNNYGRFLFSTGRMDEADYQFTMALRLNPGYADALNNKAGSLGMKAGSYVVLAQKYPAGAAVFWNQRAITLFNQIVAILIESNSLIRPIIFRPMKQQL